MHCLCETSAKRGGCDGEADIRLSPLCLECEERGCKAPPLRIAQIHGRPSVATVQDYLPSNYYVRQRLDGTIFVEGYDDHGWTLDGYVIPRLGSGLIAAREVTGA